MAKLFSPKPLKPKHLNSYFLYCKNIEESDKMPKGRPIKSEIRQNIIEILYFMKQGYGYEIYKAYIRIFPKVTMRSIYYHLKKGTALGEFKVDKVEKEKGEYSWGGEAEKTYYALSSNAKPTGNEKARGYFKKKT